MNEIENLVEKALEIAKEAHKGQLDKAGVDYIQHPLNVAAMVESPEEKAVALLHDVIEDTDISVEDLRTKGMPGDVVEAVFALTKLKDIDYFEYLNRVKDNPLARKVKLADLSHNSDISRIPNPREKDKERIKKYKLAIEYLSN